MPVHALAKIERLTSRQMALEQLSLKHSGQVARLSTLSGFEYTIIKRSVGFIITIPSLNRTFHLNDQGKILSATGGPIPEIRWQDGTGEEPFYPVDILIDAIRVGDIDVIERYYRPFEIEQERSAVRRRITRLVGPKAAPLDWMKSILGLKTYAAGKLNGGKYHYCHCTLIFDQRAQLGFIKVYDGGQERFFIEVFSDKHNKQMRVTSPHGATQSEPSYTRPIFNDILTHFRANNFS